MPPFPSPTKTYHQTTYPSLSPTLPALSAKGKTIVITGGGTGIGAATARSFAEAGASRVVLIGRREGALRGTKGDIEKEFGVNGVEVVVVAADVTKGDEVDGAFKRAVSSGASGGGEPQFIDVLVHGAAIIGPQESVEAVDTNKFLAAVDANLRGTLNVAKAFLRHAAPDAVVIDVNSSAAHVNFVPGFAAYSVAKMGVCRLWDSFANANPGLVVFHVQPGVVDTDMNREAGGVGAVGFEDHVSLPATFHVWLASPEARFLKNKFLWANWDVDELKARAKELEATTQLTIGLSGWPFQEGEYKFKSADGSWEK